ncbi:YkoF family thiamine/hydroxymethylpyrimidine-binding protein [Alloscardovia sp. HMSC034E08]|uniref:YkoF family thiamine/hydroxymethylpyrimidine-binding protein n=1 Tax=Alloscardovia sp. HMSC034E08 TaxID=1739413 RepID=UPI0008BEC7B8|nr:YkoF family thiamine/hydroxymethylpyrimidine-binding protein [Alloscardovia sp. HMSC034E08]OFQ99944.1 hypothetical protein HMPREF2909_05510 [Alloscardovia sp. HMSC034E08]
MTTSTEHVTYGNTVCGIDGASLQITGCRFSASPMCDNFVDILMNAIAQTDTSKIWSDTDEMSTVYRGRDIHVVDAVRAFFTGAEQPNVHMTMEATFSKGCPGDRDADVYLDENDELANAHMRNKHFPVRAKIALYPMGVDDYMHHIAHIVNHAIDAGIYSRTAHYNTYLAGDVQDIFDYIAWTVNYCGSNIHHYIFEVTLSVHSPSVSDDEQ